jgi:transposase InsO family protein
MRQQARVCQLKRRLVVTTDCRHGERRYPNLIRDLVGERPDQVGVADSTYIRLPTAFAYLAAILDAYPRPCVGWKLSRTIDTDLALAALDHALARRRPAPGLIQHADQGAQYASTAYGARVEAVGAQISMAAVGNPNENAPAERFFRTLKPAEG